MIVLFDTQNLSLIQFSQASLKYMVGVCSFFSLDVVNLIYRLDSWVPSKIDR